MATVTTKGDIVILALRKSAIASNSTLTEPEPQMVEDALTDLELFMYEIENMAVTVGYLFSDPDIGPDTNDLHGMSMGDVNGIALNLAKRILTDVLKPVPDSLATQAQQAYDAILYRVIDIPQLQRRNDMPRGIGNKAFGYWDRFYHETDPLTTGDGTPIDNLTI